MAKQITGQNAGVTCTKAVIPRKPVDRPISSIFLNLETAEQAQKAVEDEIVWESGYYDCTSF